MLTSAMLLMAAVLAQAIPADGFNPPVLEETGVGWAAMAAILAAVAIGAVGFKNSRRTHLD